MKISKQLLGIIAGIGLIVIMSLLLFTRNPLPTGLKPQQPSEQHQAIASAMPVKNSSINPTHILFDLEGVLFTIDKKKAMGQLSYFDLLAHSMAGNNIEDL